MNPLNVLGVVGYNGVSFGPSLKSSVSMDPQYDESQRTIIYYVAHFRFEFWVDVSDPNEPDLNDPATTTDSMFEDMRDALMHPAGAFQYAGNGLGGLNVNPAQGVTPAVVSQTTPRVYDCVWGPKPRRVTFEGTNGKAAKCSFEVDVALANCPDVLTTGGVLESNFKIQWDVSEGYTKRTYSGYIRIAQTRKSVMDRTLQANADSLLENVTPAVPTGFFRRPITRTLSYDKCRLDFSITDEQHPSLNFPPSGVVQVRATHSVRTERKGFIHWTATLDAEYEMARGLSGALAYAAFEALFKDRIAETLLNPVTDAGVSAKLSVVPFRFEMREEIYGRKHAYFSLSYTYSTDVDSVLKATALWRPAPGNGYKSWAQSMQDYKVWGPRGYAQHKFNNADDVIVDICRQSNTPVVPTPPGDKTNPPEPRPPLLKITTTPGPENSWIDYHLRGSIKIVHPTVEHRLLQSVNPAAASGDVNSESGYRVPYSGGEPSLIQYRTAPTMIYVLEGRALRAGYRITPPRAVSVGGVAVVPFGREVFETDIVANYGVPIVRAFWRQQYVIPSVPSGGIGPPPNPTLGGLGGTGRGELGGGIRGV